jgi:hypothetical protein
MKTASALDRGVRLAAVAAGVLLLLSPASAEIVTVKGTSGNICVNPECLPSAVVPVIQGATTDYTLVGNFTDYVARASVSPAGGVSATFDTSHAGLLDTSSIRMRVAVAPDAAPGERVMTLTKSDGRVPDLQPMRVRVVVVRKGTVTGAPVTVVPNFFNEADVRLVGRNIGNAGVDVDIPGVTTKTVVSNSDTELVIKLRFSTRLGEARGRIRLWDKACGSCTVVARYWYQGTDGPVGFTPVLILGPNALKDISVMTGAQTGGFVAGQSSTVTVTLLRAVDNLTGVTTTTATRSAAPVGTTGVTVYWKMDPQVATPSSGQVVIPAGRDSATFSVLTKGYILAGNSAYFYPSSLKVEARTGSPTATQAPELRVGTFPAK